MKRSILLSSIFAIAFSTPVLCQNIIPLNEEKIIYFGTIGDTVLSIVPAIRTTDKIGIHRYVISNRSIPIDTIHYLPIIPELLNNPNQPVVYFLKKNGKDNSLEYSLKKVRISEGAIDVLETSKLFVFSAFKDKFYALSNNNNYVNKTKPLIDLPEGTEAGVPEEKLKNELIEIDGSKNTQQTIADLNKLYGDSYFGEFYKIYASPYAKKLLLITAKTDDGAYYYDFDYIIFNQSTSELTKYIFDFESERQKREGVDFGIFFYDSQFEDAIVTSNGYILESNFNVIGRCLERNINSPIGFNYLNGSYISSNIICNLDEPKSKWSDLTKKVILDYSFNRELEQILYIIKNNELVVPKGLENLNLKELLICKNMIFARHNYSFNSELYQAFFNQFSFYNNKFKRKNRTKEVNNLLTEIDLKNIQIINKVINLRTAGGD